jgi:hypothetical protein
VIHCVHLEHQWVANSNDSLFILSTPSFFLIISAQPLTPVAHSLHN